MISVGRNPFKKSQQAKIERRTIFIKGFLKMSQSGRQKYDYVTDLAHAVASHISIVELRDGLAQKKCYPETLLRSVAYRPLLDSYLAETAARGLKASSKQIRKSGSASASHILLSELEFSNLRLENTRLKLYISQIETRGAPKLSVTSDQVDASHQARELAKMEFCYVSTCETIMTILSKLDEFLSVDITNRRILDASKRRGDNEIAGGAKAAPFFDWLNKLNSSK